MCYNCKKPSHFAKDCLDPKREGFHAIYDDTGEVVENVASETLNTLIEHEELSAVADNSSEVCGASDTSSGEICSLDDGSDYNFCSCDSGERIAAMRSIEPDSSQPMFMFRDPTTQEWIIRESLDEIVEFIQQQHPRVDRYSDDISLRLEVTNEQVTNQVISPDLILSNSQPDRLNCHCVNRISQWVREQTSLNTIVDDEYGPDSSPESSSSKDVIGSESDYESFTEYSEAFVEHEFDDMPDLQDVSDLSVNSDIEYMESDLNGEEIDCHSNENESANDLVIEGLVDYETYHFMKEWLGGMSEVNESLVAISSTTPISH